MRAAPLTSRDHSYCTFISLLFIAFAYLFPYLGQGNSLNLDVDVLGESLDGDAAAGRLVGKELLVDRVHLLHLVSVQVTRVSRRLERGAYGKVVHGGEEDVALDDLGDGGAGLLEDGLEVRAALAGLVGDGSLNHGALGGEGDLAGAVDGVGGLDGLGL